MNLLQLLYYEMTELLLRVQSIKGKELYSEGGVLGQVEASKNRKYNKETK